MCLPFTELISNSTSMSYRRNELTMHLEWYSKSWWLKRDVSSNGTHHVNGAVVTVMLIEGGLLALSFAAFLLWGWGPTLVWRSHLDQMTAYFGFIVSEYTRHDWVVVMGRYSINYRAVVIRLKATIGTRSSEGERGEIGGKSHNWWEN